MSSKTDDFNLDFLNDIPDNTNTNTTGPSSNAAVGGNPSNSNGATGPASNNGSTNSGNNAVPSSGQGGSNNSNDEFSQLFG